MEYTHIRYNHRGHVFTLALWLSPKTISSRIGLSLQQTERMLADQVSPSDKITFIIKEPKMASKIRNYVRFLAGGRSFTFPIKYSYTKMSDELNAEGVQLSRQQCSALTIGAKGCIKDVTVELLTHADLDPNTPEPGQGYDHHPMVLTHTNDADEETEVCRFDGNAHKASIIKLFGDKTNVQWDHDMLLRLTCGGLVEGHSTMLASEWDSLINASAVNRLESDNQPNMVMVRNSDVYDAANEHQNSTVLFTFNGADDHLQISREIKDCIGEALGTDMIAQLLNGGRVCGLRAWTTTKWNNMLKEKAAQTVSTASEPKTTTITVKQKTTVFVTLQKEFIHHFPAAGKAPEFATGDELDVSFLAHPHRHMWGFRIETEVFHDDRDIEFIQLKRIVESYLNTLPLDLGPMSCEQFAKQIIETLTKVFGARYWDVVVDEDGENGARVTSTPVHV